MPILRFPSFSGTMPPAPYALTAPLLGKRPVFSALLTR